MIPAFILHAAATWVSMSSRSALSIGRPDMQAMRDQRIFQFVDRAQDLLGEGRIAALVVVAGKLQLLGLDPDQRHQFFRARPARPAQWPR